MTDRHSAPRIVYRYLSGRPLDGRTDGGYLHGSAGASTWARWPGWRRQAVRLAAPAAVCGSWAAYSAEPTLTALGATVLAGTAGTRAARSVRRAWRTRRFRHAYIRPTLAALAPALGDAPVRLHVDPSLGTLLPRLARPMSPAETAVRTWYGQRVEPVLRWLPDQGMRGWWALQRAARPVTGKVGEALRVPAQDAGPRIELTAAVPYLTAEQRQYVSSVVGAKIPAGELVESWDQVGVRVRATWTVRRRPPARVGYADLTARLDQLAEWEYFIGLGVGGKPVVISLRDDSPHIACSAGSGAGKSVLAQLVAVQVLARGGRVVLLDRKGSHRWALGLPGVDYCTRPEQMAAVLVRLAALADQRNTDSLLEEEGWDPGPRVLVIAEELNATMAQIRGWWDEVREKGQPKIPPAVRAFRELLFMGRSAKINLLAIAQMLTAQTTGGPESRENFGVRCLARYTRNNWQMLVPEAAMPRASRTLGRWQIVVGGVAAECQVCYLSAAEARLLVHKARAGVHMPADTLDGPLTRNVHMDAQDHVDVPPVLTLQDSIDEGICPWSLATAQKRLQRARAGSSATVPTPTGKRQRADLYERSALIAWIESELIS
jgi:hypothetical protein